MNMPDWQRSKLHSTRTTTRMLPDTGTCVVPKKPKPVTFSGVMRTGHGGVFRDRPDRNVSLRDFCFAEEHDLDVLLHQFHLEPTCGNPNCINPNHQHETQPRRDLIAEGIEDLKRWIKTNHPYRSDFPKYRSQIIGRSFDQKFSFLVMKVAYERGELDEVIAQMKAEWPRPEHHRRHIRDRFGVSLPDTP